MYLKTTMLDSVCVYDSNRKRATIVYLNDNGTPGYTTFDGVYDYEYWQREATNNIIAEFEKGGCQNNGSSKAVEGDKAPLLSQSEIRGIYKLARMGWNNLENVNVPEGLVVDGTSADRERKTLTGIDEL